MNRHILTTIESTLKRNCSAVYDRSHSIFGINGEVVSNYNNLQPRTVFKMLQQIFQSRVVFQRHVNWFRTASWAIILKLKEST